MSYFPSYTFYTPAKHGWVSTVQKLSDIKGLSEAKVEKLLDAARKLCTDYGWRSATRVEQQVWTPSARACHQQPAAEEASRSQCMLGACSEQKRLSRSPWAPQP